MKDFMMIFFGDDYEDMGLSPEQIQGRMGKWFAWNEQMKANGVEANGNALKAPGKHMSGADAVVTDGPFMEGKELIGGYYVFKAKDMDAAVEVAKGFPDFDLGSTVEVREVMVFE